MESLLLPLPRIKDWARSLSAYFSAQTLTQLAGIGAGILLIRALPVSEFALYTLAFSVVTFFTFLSDLGSTSSLLHFFRRAAAEGDDFGSYYAAVLSLRRAAFLVGALGVAVAFPWIASRKGYPLAESLPVTIGIALCVWFQLTAALRLLALRLADRYPRSYRAEIAGGFARLAVAAAVVLSGWLRASFGVLSSVAGSAVTAVLAKDPGSRAAAWAQAAPGDLGVYRRRVVRYLLPTLPSALYFAVQGPLLVWLSATFGSTRTIAEVGALGRLSLVVSLFNSLTSVVFLPRLAGIADERHYLTRYLQCLAFLAAVVAALVAAAALLPGAFLFVLGPQYRGLHRELVLLVLASGLALLDGFTLGVNTARSWNRAQAAALLVLFAVQAAAVATLDLSTTRNVLVFNVCTAAVGFLSQAAMNLAGFLRPRWVHWS